MRVHCIFPFLWIIIHKMSMFFHKYRIEETTDNLNNEHCFVDSVIS